MKKFFSPNIDSRGRIVRGLGGGTLILLGISLWDVNLLASVIIISLGGFVLFEAVRGWCVMRACGIKTKL